jgi:hypothetical protein
MNRGTREGEDYEKDFCIRFNKRDSKLNIEILNNYCLENLYAVHVKYHKFSFITEKKVKPKSDVFLVNLSKNEIDSCKRNNFFLDEDSLENIQIKYLPESGISIKNLHSKKYQIHKFTCDSFERTFNDKFLFIGHLIYERKNMIHKNNDIFDNLKIPKDVFLRKFDFLHSESDPENLKYQKIKTYCKNQICDAINNSEKIQDIVFSGKGVFEDPFYASYFFQDDMLVPMKIDKYTVTTGSGRSRGNYTIVIKP